MFPVADGDTGRQHGADAARRDATSSTASTARRSTTSAATRSSQAVARAALLGARGNSGVILSQVVRGAAEELSSRPGELVDPVLVSAALARAADAAYSSVRDPAEGTMITVVREMAHRVATELAHMEKAAARRRRHRRRAGRRCSPRCSSRRSRRREASVERSPELLPVLREHGVVDAGGYGVTLLVAGVDRRPARRRTTRLPEVAHHAVALQPHGAGSRIAAAIATAPTSSSRAGGSRRAAPRPARSRRSATRCWSSATAATLRVHVHTDEPERAVAVFDRRRHGRAPRRRGHARAAGAARRAARGPQRQPAASTGDALRRRRGRGGRRACAASTSSSARTWSRAGRRSTRAPSSCWPASTRSPPTRSSCCRTART